MSRLIPVLVLAALSPYASPVFGAEVVTNAAKLLSFSKEDLAGDGIPFALTGTVVDDTLLPSIDDGSSGIRLNAPLSFPYEIGDIVSVWGTACVRPYVPRSYMVTRARLVGKGRRPPVLRADPRRIACGDYDFKRISLEGLVIDTFTDEIDPDFYYLVVKCGTCDVYAAVHKQTATEERIASIVGAEANLTGFCLPEAGGCRTYLGHIVLLHDISSMRVLRPPVTDPDEYPALEAIQANAPAEIHRIGDRRISGTVLAAWDADQFLLQSADGKRHRVKLAEGQRLPKIGDRVTAGGHVATDFYFINLTQAICKRTGHDAAPAAGATPARPSDILCRDQMSGKIDTTYYGRAVRLTGTIAKPHSDVYDANKLYLDCGTHVVPVNVSALGPELVARLRPGCKAELSGVCLMDVDNWQPTVPFPRIRGVFLAVRTPDDVRILSQPSWWTPARMLTAIGSLVLALLAILVWNLVLNRIVERRSRELFHEQIAHARAALKVEERTRLAVELHDSLSQNLTGVACQISATRSMIPAGPDAVASHLDVAERMLTSSRAELKRCLWDLREDTLEDADLTSAIVRTVAPVIGEARLSVRFNVARSRISDSSAHSILCIVRELATNAVRHGKAAHVRVAGESHDGILTFSVSDDGTGFSPDRCPGIDKGHFGLEGIRERVRRLEGDFTLRSAPGRGTYAKITVRLPNPNGQQEEPTWL